MQVRADNNVFASAGARSIELAAPLEQADCTTRDRLYRQKKTPNAEKRLSRVLDKSSEFNPRGYVVTNAKSKELAQELEDKGEGALARIMGDVPLTTTALERKHRKMARWNFIHYPPDAKSLSALKKKGFDLKGAGTPVAGSFKPPGS